jgi:hypothetical protein
VKKQKLARFVHEVAICRRQVADVAKNTQKQEDFRQKMKPIKSTDIFIMVKIITVGRLIITDITMDTTTEKWINCN